MKRGKPKPLENLAERNVKSAFSYSKKFPAYRKGKIERGELTPQGVKKLRIQLAKQAVPDSTIASILVRRISGKISLEECSRKIAEYASRKVGIANKESAINYLRGVYDNLAAQARLATPIAMKLAASRRELTEQEKKDFYANTIHHAVTAISIFCGIIDNAKSAIEFNEIKLIPRRHTNARK